MSAISYRSSLQEAIQERFNAYDLHRSKKTSSFALSFFGSLSAYTEGTVNYLSAKWLYPLALPVKLISFVVRTCALLEALIVDKLEIKPRVHALNATFAAAFNTYNFD